MLSTVKSLAIWIGIVILILIWLPLLAVSRLFDRDPARYRTGKLFRKLGKYISKINPNWQIVITGYEHIDDRRPYVMVCNHLSQADIPLISNLPWEMKWVAKKELFDTPVIGWMMKLAGDISVDRKAPDRREQTLLQARHYLNHDCSVIFFPEGTRSRNGKLSRFKAGAFDLAIREKIPILPMVIDGTQNTLPKRSWKFGVAKHIKLKVLDPISTEGMQKSDIRELTTQVRQDILDQLSEWRNQEPENIDNMS
ncbi:1-acyl-sn-glycerol-3-phosphate acyltransferase [Aliifodinibius salipaludis]|uniref:1-acyl-sn-glycerol-3-phosphate acyltransferase n=1 Tax=Fodinibius salipaludis TaxID=2032627 RepID=A0A2A2GAQ1_9BACT|nr:lysophospholipid acyltransferase family protein [Aliifodinibius salipaludis]PAU93882.1 1-acyl-sn-glycerol-3-phosphate acyltransferase [Aliifodinibius salipaludis]